MRLLISFCNNKVNDGITGLLGMLSIRKNRQAQYENIDLIGLNLKDVRGVTGLCSTTDGFAVHIQSKTPLIAELNYKFEVVRMIQLNGLKGIHTLRYQQNCYYMAVTGLDKICKTNGNVIEDVWSKNTGKDTIHLNSICFKDDDLFFTAFGGKSNNRLWSSATNGFVQSINCDHKKVCNIWHPHSLTWYDNDLYYCHSSAQSVESTGGEVYSDLPGYTRGLYISKDWLVCGTSIGRLISHSTGVKVSNLSGVGKTGGVCGIYYKNRNSGKSFFYDLSKVATEVFDIIEVPD